LIFVPQISQKGSDSIILAAFLALSFFLFGFLVIQYKSFENAPEG